MDFIYNINIKELFNNFAGYIGITGPLSVIRAIVDIGLVTYVIYKIIILVRETRAWQLIKGIIFILIAAELSKVLKLNTIAYLLNRTVSILALAMVVLFQPELRRVLEQVGRSRFRNLFVFEDSSNQVKTSAMIEDIVKACTELSRTFTGALIVIERETKIGDIIRTGVQLDANITPELLLNIFYPNTPLHDGAVIIRNDKIVAAGCYLPLTENPNLSKELGTRHRAALGVTEESDAVAIIVSEETGVISVAKEGKLTRYLDVKTLKNMLRDIFEIKEKKPYLWQWRRSNG